MAPADRSFRPEVLRARRPFQHVMLAAVAALATTVVGATWLALWLAPTRHEAAKPETSLSAAGYEDSTLGGCSYYAWWFDACSFAYPGSTCAARASPAPCPARFSNAPDDGIKVTNATFTVTESTGSVQIQGDLHLGGKIYVGDKELEVVGDRVRVKSRLLERRATLVTAPLKRAPRPAER